jgi:hypothetical protein
MEASQKCPECGTVWTNEQTCEGCFHQMLFWEAEHPAYGEVHHLMVLCYYLQHPSLYSPAGLHEARQLLQEFVDRGTSPAEIRQRNRDRVDSRKREWKITSTADAHGSYDFLIQWTMTTANVVAGGSENYCDNMPAWARSINETLRAVP